jgi:hypothetical protein
VSRLVPLVSAVIVLAVAFAAVGKPDLVVTDLQLSPPHPSAGASVIVSVLVENEGTSDAREPFDVRALVDGSHLGMVSVANGLRAGEAKRLSFDWTAEAGTHEITAQVDQPFDRINESDETNNALTVSADVPFAPDTLAKLTGLRIAVARFDDRSGSGFINLGGGVADKLVARLVRSGVRVLERSDLEAVMQERDLNPAIPQDLATAGQFLGADILIVGSVTDVRVQQAALSLGFFSLRSASADVSVSARLVNVYTSEVAGAVSASGSAEGATGFSIDIGKITTLNGPTSGSLCSGGLRTDKPCYDIGEAIPIGWRNATVPGWYGVEIRTQAGIFVRWLNWQYLTTGQCGTWYWNQRDAMNASVAPGTYTAKLWNGVSYIASVNLLIKPGGGTGLFIGDEITVGTQSFDQTIVGQALDQALDQLVSRLVFSLESVAPTAMADRSTAEAAAPSTAPAPTLEGQIAAILPDGRVAINIGATAGVKKGDFFGILATENVVTDPTTGRVLSYDAQGSKGEIVITEVRDQAAYGVRTTEFSPVVGDVVRLKDRTSNP